MAQDFSTLLQHIKVGALQKAIEMVYADSYWQRIACHRFKNFERKLNPPHEWQDIFHEAVIRFVQQVAKGGEVQHGGNYFGMICHNICFKELEKLEGRKSKKDDEENALAGNEAAERGISNPKPALMTIVAPVLGMENIPETEPQNPMVRMIELSKYYLSQLDERDRDILNLKYFRPPLAESDKDKRKDMLKTESELLAKKWSIGIDSIPPLATLAKNRWIDLMKRHRSEFEDLDQFPLF